MLLQRLLFAVLLTVSSQSTFAQSQALNGQIEGVVIDLNGSAVPGINVTVTNLEAGATRSLLTGDSGTFRFPLMPLGNYRITAEAPGFKKFMQEGVTLTTGQTATLTLTLDAGEVREGVTVTSDAPVANPGKMEVGRVVNSREVKNLPLITLNPYQFVFLQSNVTGNRTQVPGFGFVNVNTNGFSRRGNYQIDGNYATEVRIGGVRMLVTSQPYVHEIQLLTSGMSAEFGGTVGHLTNVVTPSGTNTIHGNVSYQFRRNGFAAQRFNVPPGTPNHQPVADVVTASIGGPVIRDRWHYYAGFEAFKWDLASAARTITITDQNRQALIAAGVPAEVMPVSYKAPEAYSFFIGRTDVQINSSNRLGARFLLTDGISEKIGANRLNTLQVTTDVAFTDTSFAAQLVSNKGERLFNELRLQRSSKDTSALANEFTGMGHATIRIQGVAVFGAPTGTAFNVGTSVLSTVQNNLSLVLANHSIKIGGGLAYNDSIERSVPSNEYLFATTAAYVAASTGPNPNPRSYSRYTELFGDPRIRVRSWFWNAFIQDEWRVNRRLRINAGLRYDLFVPPDSDPSAAFAPSRKFHIDRNNFGPRLSFSYLIGEGERPTVFRASAGVYYDPPIINYNISALRNNGTTHLFTVRFGPNASATTLQGPEFPGAFGTFPTGQTPPPFAIDALDPDFKTMSALHANIQFEKALAQDLSFTVAYSHSSGRHTPTSRNINCLPVPGTLADGRPVYRSLPRSTVVEPCPQRPLPQFQDIRMWESVGNLDYNATAFILSKRFSSGYQFSLNYTLSRSVDDAPEENLPIAFAQRQSDPSNRRVDKAISVTDQTHTLAATFVGRPQFRFTDRLLNYVANHNQFGIIVRASDGERYNVVSALDLNGDGVLMDRPVGIPRNFLKTPPFFNLDLRYSRIVRLSERVELELFADITNVTNTNSIIGFGNTTLGAQHVDPLTGNLRSLPDFESEVISTDSRRMQLGIKFTF